MLSPSPGTTLWLFATCFAPPILLGADLPLELVVVVVVDNVQAGLKGFVFASQGPPLTTSLGRSELVAAPHCHGPCYVNT